MDSQDSVKDKPQAEAPAETGGQTENNDSMFLDIDQVEDKVSAAVLNKVAETYVTLEGVQKLVEEGVKKALSRKVLVAPQPAAPPKEPPKPPTLEDLAMADFNHRCNMNN